METPNEDLISSVVSEVRARVATGSNRTVPSLRRIRKEFTRRLRHQNNRVVFELVLRLITAPDVPRWFAYELLHYHKPTMAILTPERLEQVGAGLSSWGDVDSFACYLSGPAWREGRVTSEDVHGWAASEDRWWRRAALVSTVPLNNTVRGGSGDADQTLALCDRLKLDRDDMVVKAMSWALRELTGKDPVRVEEFLQANHAGLAPRIVREVRNKLMTGLKNPKSRRAASDARTSD